MSGPQLNYHHLQYFWAVAREGNLTRAARQLHVSQSALSTQIRLLEDQLGQPLFLREGRRLSLTEAGRVAFTFAEEIFRTGGELVATLEEGRQRTQVLRIGAVATLSRNFQESFVAPLLGMEDIRLRMVSGRLDALLARLAAHELDLVLSNRRVSPDETHRWHCHPLARQEISIVAHPGQATFRFPEDLARVPLLLPGADSAIRAAFDALCERLDLRVRVLAEIDDMAMMRLLARDMEAVALLPTVVVRDELQSGQLRECCVVPDLFEDFYAITVERRYRHPLVKMLLSRSEDEILGMG